MVLGHTPRLIVFSAFLTRLARHGALLVVLLVLGRAAGRHEIGEGGIAAVAAGAALLHLVGSALRLRAARRAARAVWST